MRLLRLKGMLAALCLILPGAAHADQVADFYRNKTITFTVVFAPGGSFDLYSRLAAHHLSNFIPGNPKIIVQNLPGAGGLTGAVKLANQAAQDGTELGMVDRSIAVTQVMRAGALPLDAGKFNWIGSISSYSGVLYVTGRTGVKTPDDLRRLPVVMGSWGVETSSYTFPILLNALAGTKFKVVTGYRGANDVEIAVERNEVDGRLSSWSSLKAAKAGPLADGSLVVVMQTGVRRNPDLPSIPLIPEMATTEQGRRILQFIDSESGIGWAVLAPPGVPLDRVAALRHAFDQMVVDPRFLADTQGRNLDVMPVTGQEVEAIVKRTLSIPRDDIDVMNALIAAASK
jgi:tripartite-type tricarboxylate transporter receptor subunit TctC